MNKEQALSLLGLESGATDSEIDAAYQHKKSQTNQKLESAPTDALKAKFREMSKQLDDARQILLANSSAQSPAQNPGGPSLSATKLADLPNAGPGLEGETIQLSVGQQLAGRYEVREQIGAGGMGAVYRALDSNTGQEIALKVLLPSLARNERARERFLDEARISQKLSHPNIVNVYDVEQDGDLVFLTMELLEGQDLREAMENRKLARQQFTEAELKQLANELCAALAYAHKHTVHRDLKPENVWLTEDGDYKLMDFGIARVQSTSQRTQTGAAMGTAYYMAPEQLKGAANIDGRADQYALAVLLYELLSGDVPAGRFKPVRELRKDISRGMAAAIEQGLETRPEDRLADMNAFAAAIANGKGGGVRLPSLNLSGGKGIAAGVVLVLALLGAGVVTGTLGEVWDAVRPTSAAERLALQGEAISLQSEVRTLKRRLDTRKRDLEQSIRDASREKDSRQEKALEGWRRLVNQHVVDGSRQADYEGRESFAEVQLRNENYAETIASYTEARDGFAALLEDFTAAEALVEQKPVIESLRSRWLTHDSAGDWPVAASVESRFTDAEAAYQASQLSAALLSYRQLQPDYEALLDAADNLTKVDRDLATEQRAWDAQVARQQLGEMETVQAMVAREQTLREQLAAAAAVAVITEAMTGLRALTEEYRSLTQAVANIGRQEKSAGDARRAWQNYASQHKLVAPAAEIKQLDESYAAGMAALEAEDVAKAATSLQAAEAGYRTLRQSGEQLVAARQRAIANRQALENLGQPLDLDLNRHATSAYQAYTKAESSVAGAELVQAREQYGSAASTWAQRFQALRLASEARRKMKSAVALADEAQIGLEPLSPGIVAAKESATKGEVALKQGHYEQARDLYEEASEAAVKGEIQAKARKGRDHIVNTLKALDGSWTAVTDWASILWPDGSTSAAYRVDIEGHNKLDFDIGECHLGIDYKGSERSTPVGGRKRGATVSNSEYWFSAVIDVSQLEPQPPERKVWMNWISAGFNTVSLGRLPFFGEPKMMTRDGGQVSEWGTHMIGITRIMQTFSDDYYAGSGGYRIRPLSPLVIDTDKLNAAMNDWAALCYKK